MIQYGKIEDFKYESLGSGKKLLVKVSVDDRVTNWLPVKTNASSFLIEHTPVRIGDQVIVFNPFGNNEDGFVDRNINYKDIPLPNNIHENLYYKEFEDGTIYQHDVKEKHINLTTPCDVFIESKQLITIKAPQVIMDAEVSITKNLKVTEEITDKLGNLTNHEHDVKDHSTAVPR
ncbi:MAG TPA: hypothetical protein EYG70_09285 [Sulfurimonas sp.]|nr:hypothetical protein [Sulfurimonas sp.]